MQGKSLPKTRRALLALVLYEHPKRLSIDDVRRAIGPEADAAVYDLRVAALLHKAQGRVYPTWAALSYHRLESS